MVDPIAVTSGPELIIGLVGPVGTDLAIVKQALERVLETFHYDVRLVRLSNLIHQVDKFAHLAEEKFQTEGHRIRKYINAGTELREIAARGDLLALLSISEIRTIRERVNETNKEIVDSDRADIPLQELLFFSRHLNTRMKSRRYAPSMARLA